MSQTARHRVYAGRRQASYCALVWACALGLLLLAAGPSHAADPAPAAAGPELSEAQVNAIWGKQWFLFARGCARIGQRYEGLDYDPTYPSSRRTSVAMVLEQKEKELTQVAPTGFRVYAATVTIPRPEAEAIALSLPALEVGQWGYVHSAQIKEILGPQDMIVEDLWLIDEEQLDALKRDALDRAKGRDISSKDIDVQFRERDALVKRQRGKEFRQALWLRGWDTEGLKEGSRWYGRHKGDGVTLAVVDQRDLLRAQFAPAPPAGNEGGEAAQAEAEPEKPAEKSGKSRLGIRSSGSTPKSGRNSLGIVVNGGSSRSSAAGRSTAKGKSEQMLVAIALGTLEGRLTEVQTLDMVRQAGFEKAQFVQTLQQKLLDDPVHGREAMFRLLRQRLTQAQEQAALPGAGNSGE